MSRRAVRVGKAGYPIALGQVAGRYDVRACACPAHRLRVHPGGTGYPRQRGVTGRSGTTEGPLARISSTPHGSDMAAPGARRPARPSGLRGISGTRSRSGERGVLGGEGIAGARARRSWLGGSSSVDRHPTAAPCCNGMALALLFILYGLHSLSTFMGSPNACQGGDKSRLSGERPVLVRDEGGTGAGGGRNRDGTPRVPGGGGGVPKRGIWGTTVPRSCLANGETR